MKACTEQMLMTRESPPSDDFLALFEGFDEHFIAVLEARDDTPPQEGEPW